MTEDFEPSCCCVSTAGCEHESGECGVFLLTDKEKELACCSGCIARWDLNGPTVAAS